ncbi:GntR family transcriptional regulator [Sunxiuqinia sp. sy24]|uniref:GntR family transcriptional regulator n=1 Tax=Sunxiuqinia sp. sy24 TaxID=3461495 RepID=UPI004045F842
MSLFQIYKDNEFAGYAKYIQLVNAVKRSIEKGELKKSDRLPSITELRKNLGVGKETILKAIDLLKEEGVITAIPGKGFFVAKTRLAKVYRLFVLFDEFTAYKRDLYHSMLEGLSKKGEIQLFFHHYNPRLFNKLIIENLGDFTHYIVMPFPGSQVKESLKLVPRDKLYILDRNEMIPKRVPAVFQDYGQDVYDGFFAIKDHLNKYDKVILVFPSHLNHPASIVNGFERLCDDANIIGEVVDRVDFTRIDKGQAWFVIEDHDLVDVVEVVQNRRWEIGKDLGIISYNDTAMKRIAAGGITTLSTDFKEMGKTMITMIISGKDRQVRSMGRINDRGSL